MYMFMFICEIIKNDYFTCNIHSEITRKIRILLNQVICWRILCESYIYILMVLGSNTAWCQLIFLSSPLHLLFIIMDAVCPTLLNVAFFLKSLIFPTEHGWSQLLLLLQFSTYMITWHSSTYCSHVDNWAASYFTSKSKYYFCVKDYLVHYYSPQSHIVSYLIVIICN